MSKYIFRKMNRNEPSQMFQMILERMKWMDEKGIKQWNVTKYDEVYPLSYYEKAQKNGEVYVLYDTDAKQIVAAAILKDNDERWNGSEKSLYLHNFVAKIGEKGAGSLFLSFTEEYARSTRNVFLRLDSAENNTALSHYYESHGFSPVGNCVDGLYRGILREKRLMIQ